MPNVPHPILDAVRCVRCKIWISCGPILLLPNGKSVCGRCHKYKEGPNDNYHHFAFEALACYFKFPCKNWSDHCPEWLPFKKVLAHEKNCSYNSTCSIFCSHCCVAFKNKRFLNTRAEITLEVIPEEVLDYLRCGSCAGYLSCTPVFVCRDGTSLCHRCSTQIPPTNEFIQDTMFEKFADMMIFPCIFRYRGCAQYFKFGGESWQHELECGYGKPISISRVNSNREIAFKNETQAMKRPESVLKGIKEKGVITTYSGHIYATLTPNAPLFGPRPIKRPEQSMFYDEFEKHRENLASKWGRPAEERGRVDFTLPAVEDDVESQISDVKSERPETSFGEMGPGYPSLISELKYKQQYIKNNILNNRQSNGQSNGANITMD